MLQPNPQTSSLPDCYLNMQFVSTDCPDFAKEEVAITTEQPDAEPQDKCTSDHVSTS